MRRWRRAPPMPTRWHSRSTASRKSGNGCSQALQVIQSQVDAFTTTESRNSAEYFTSPSAASGPADTRGDRDGQLPGSHARHYPHGSVFAQPIRDALIGLAAGLVVGIGLALLLGAVRHACAWAGRSGGSHRDADRRRPAKLPARAFGAEPLAVLSDPRGPMAEAIRKVRSNLEFANVDGDLKSLVVTSSLQHEGKSLMVCNLALSMAATGRRVVLVDGDLRRPRVHAYLHLENGVGRLDGAHGTK